jgi:hypothetical protein
MRGLDANMEAEHRDLLRSNRRYLLDNLDPDLISNALVEEKLLSEEEFDELREQRIRKKKVEFLLAKLPLKGPTAFNRFLKVLQDTPGQEFIAKKLEPRDKGTQLTGESKRTRLRRRNKKLGAIILCTNSPFHQPEHGYLSHIPPGTPSVKNKLMKRLTYHPTSTGVPGRVV